MTPQALLVPARLARRPILATQSDGRLVELVRAGYEPAFEAIVARYRKPLLRYCRRFLPESHADDVVQQTFLNAYTAMSDGQGKLHLRGWLYRIAHNASVNALRDRGLRHDQLHERLDGVERPDQALERSQGLRETLAAVQALPARQRDALLLRELEGRSYDEIAFELGVSGGAVRQLLNRARTTLRHGATALAPAGLVMRLPWNEPAEPLAARIAEVCGTGSGVVAAKLCATALMTGALLGGIAALPCHHGGDREAAGVEDAPSSDWTAGAGQAADTGLADERGAGGAEVGSAGEARSSGSGVDDSEGGDDRSGTSGDDDGRSGPSGVGDDSGTAGSGSESSGTGSDDRGSEDSGTTGSGSDSSGPGSGDPGSGDSSRSGDSGTGDSGSSGTGGSGESTTTVDGNSGPGSVDSSDSGETLASTDSSADAR